MKVICKCGPCVLECGSGGKKIKKWELRQHDAAALSIILRAGGATIPFEQTAMYRKLHIPDASPSLPTDQSTPTPYSVFRSEAQASSSAHTSSLSSQNNNDVQMGSMDDYELSHLPQPDASSPTPDSPPLDGTDLPRGNLDEIAHEFDEIHGNFPFSGFGEPFLHPEIDSDPSQMPDIEMQDDRVEPRPETVPS